MSVYLNKCRELENLRFKYKTFSLANDTKAIEAIKPKIYALDKELKKAGSEIGKCPRPTGNYDSFLKIVMNIAIKWFLRVLLLTIGVVAFFEDNVLFYLIFIYLFFDKIQKR